MLLYLLRLKPCFSFSFGIRQRISVEKVESKASENSIVGAQFSFKTPPGLVSYLVSWTSRAFPNFELLDTSSIERTDDYRKVEQDYNSLILHASAAAAMDATRLSQLVFNNENSYFLNRRSRTTTPFN